MPVVVGGSKAADNVAKKVLQIHSKVWAYLEAANANYKAKADKYRHKKVFKEDNLMMVHLRWNHFPSMRTKLEKCKYGQFHVARKINDNV